jgi:hypothetical protein
VGPRTNGADTDRSPSDPLVGDLPVWQGTDQGVDGIPTTFDLRRVAGSGGPEIFDY